MKILILTSYISNTFGYDNNTGHDDYTPLAKITNKNKMDYCNYWNSKGRNYTFFPWIGYFGELYPSLAKIPLILHLLKTTDYDVIFFQDTDTFIMNFTIPVESFLDAEHSFFITQDAGWLGKSSGGCPSINAGVFIVKNNAKALELFMVLDSQTLKYSYFADQNIMEDNLHDKKWTETVKILPQRTFNSYFEDLYKRKESLGNFQKGDYLLHLPGLQRDYGVKMLQSNRVKENIIYPEDYFT